MNSHYQKWNIEYYSSQSDRTSPVEIFIEKLPTKARAKLINTFDLLIEFGSQVGRPHVKKLVNLPLWEIRIMGQDNIRIFYVIPKKKTLLLLHGFVKKKQQTPMKEIKIALTRLNKYRSETS